MKNQKSELYFVFFLLAVIFVLAFFIFQPFLYALILAIVFKTVFNGVNKKVLYITHQHKGLAAFLTTIFVILIVITPLTFLIIDIFKEATVLYSSLLSNGGLTNLSGFITNKLNNFGKFIHLPFGFSFSVNQYLKSGLDWIIQNLGSIFSNALGIVGNSLIFIFALYYLFKDGENLKESILKLSPLENTYNEKIFTKMGLAIKSVVMGSLFIAIIQGIFAAIGFAIFGVPNAIFWGSLAAIAALIPGIGTSLIIIPVVIFLFFQGNIFQAIGFLIWGLTAVAFIDNVLKPKLIERGMMIHPFFILLSVLGGIVFLGPIGLLLGPLILGLFFVLLEIHSSIEKDI